MKARKYFREAYEKGEIVMEDGLIEKRYESIDKPITIFKIMYVVPSLVLSLYLGWKAKKKKGWLEGIYTTVVSLTGFALLLQIIPWVVEHENLTKEIMKKYEKQWMPKPRTYK
ncbi:unnamed protein product [Blepharisma stoltei]|uniref:Uncharacterized protein n=1 Tax=Blepharisma stoltei TaxID=1481888 RepID=A0AAU9IPX9_9CILI|nr:unnamed protein product [Blepharisma stoltei]